MILQSTGHIVLASIHSPVGATESKCLRRDLSRLLYLLLPSASSLFLTLKTNYIVEMASSSRGLQSRFQWLLSLKGFVPNRSVSILGCPPLPNRQSSFSDYNELLWSLKPPSNPRFINLGRDTAVGVKFVFTVLHNIPLDR